MADYSINAVTRRVVYTGSAGVGPYAFSFEILAQTDIVVYKDTTKLTLTTDYTVTINANGTGSVTLVVAANSGNRITILGQRAISRTTDFVTAGDLLASALNDQLDSQIIMLQQLAEENKRTMKAPQFDPAALEDGGTLNMILPTAASRATKVLTFDSSGNPVATEEIGEYKGNWATATVYAKRDLVKDTSNNNIYRCKTAHTSSGSQPISTNTDSAKWDLIVDAAAAASSASAAAASASAAATSATNAASSASSASSSASTATTQASNASTSASNAATSASSASTSATNAANSATAASASAAAAAASAASGLYRQVLDKSANYTIVSADGGSLFRASTGSGAITFTLPQISTVTDGFKVAVVKWTSDANVVTVSRAGTDTINGATSVQIGSQYSQIILVADFETNTWFASQSGLGATNMNVDVFSGNGSTTAFTLSVDPGTKNNIHVYVGGIYQYHSTYSTSGTTLTFSSAPPSGTSNIEVWYGTPLAVGTPSDGTVTPAKLSTGGMYWDTSSNVGIGTTGPAAKLDVSNGYIRINEDGSGTKVIQLRSNWAGVDPAINVQTNNSLLFATNGTERMRIDSSGNVLLGKSSATTYEANTKLNVYSSAISQNFNVLQLTSLLSSGANVGDIVGIGFAAGESTSYGVKGSIGYVRTGNYGTGALAFYLNNSLSTSSVSTSDERMRLDSSGNLLVGQVTSSFGGKICTAFTSASQVAATFTDTVTSGYTGSYVVFLNSSSAVAGYISHPSATTVGYVASSDYRLKKDVAPLSGSLDRVMKLKPVSYTWTEDDVYGEGFIAHELQEVIPLAAYGVKDAVNEDGSIKPQGVDYGKLTTVLVAALQEAVAKIDILEARIATLEAK